MSISTDENSPAWKVFKSEEKKKFPHFEVNWFDNNGEISGDSNLRSWRSEVRGYLKDRRNFVKSLSSTFESQIQKPQGSDVKSEKSKTPLATRQRQLPTVSKAVREDSKYNMPRRTKRSQAWKGKRKSGKRRGGNKALSSVKVPFKIVMEVDSKKSGAETGHWHNHLTIAELAGPALQLHEEFKCCSIKVRFIPNDITTGAGLYAACLLDQNGFGDPAKPTTTWFPRVADLPGARIHNVMRGCVFSWHPTEPDSRNYRKSIDEKNYVVSSFYIFGNATDLSIKGQLLITGLLRARGEYYAANIATRIKALSLLDQDVPGSAADDIESLSE